MYVPPPRWPLTLPVITPFSDSMTGLMPNVLTPASGALAQANTAILWPLNLTEPFTVAKAFWLNGATVGTDSFDIGVYRMTDLSTGRCDLLRSTGAVLSAGTINAVQETATWRIAKASLTGAGSSTDATSYATASVTLKAGRLYLVAVENTKATTPDVVSAITGGPTFTSRATTLFAGSNLSRVSLWSAAPTVDYTGVLTIDFGGGNTQTGCVWAVNEFSGVDTTTNDGVVQTAVGANTASTIPTATLAAFGSANNATFGIFAGATNQAWSVAAGWIEMSDNGASTPGQSMETVWRVDNATSVAYSGTNTNWGAIGAELKADTTTPFIIPPVLNVNDIYMGISGSGSTATIFRVSTTRAHIAAMGVITGVAAGSHPLPSSLVAAAVAATTTRPVAGFSMRSLLG